jgi:hypothetical protein
MRTAEAAPHRDPSWTASDDASWTRCIADGAFGVREPKRSKGALGVVMPSFIRRVAMSRTGAVGLLQRLAGVRKRAPVGARTLPSASRADLLCSANKEITGARGRTRTDTPCGGGFSSHFGFRRRPFRRRDVRGLEHAFTLALRGRRCPPSALYTFLRASKAWLGISSDLLTLGLRRI